MNAYGIDIIETQIKVSHFIFSLKIFTTTPCICFSY